MEITYKNIKDLIPYENNPRSNDEAVKYVANSIKNFGFKSPIIIDKNNVVVCGHTRLKAAKQLKLKKVPCITADDLSDEQIKAYRLADNKVAEMAQWDYSLLDEELEGIADFDMQDFGFEFFDEAYGLEEDEPKDNERKRTDNAYNLEFNDIERTDGFYQMPIIENCNHIPTDLIGFNYVLTSDEYEKGVHFYVDDYQFERIWNDPYKKRQRKQQRKNK